MIALCPTALVQTAHLLLVAFLRFEIERLVVRKARKDPLGVQFRMAMTAFDLGRRWIDDVGHMPHGVACEVKAVVAGLAGPAAAHDFKRALLGGGRLELDREPGDFLGQIPRSSRGPTGMTMIRMTALWPGHSIMLW